ncbi:LCP family protein, partial [Georgenia sp. 10Sc9-8]|nr:LCP family protein [Georgenia halotolerans]
DAEEALGYARVRKTVGSGSDIDRIGRQQDLVAAIARDALSRNLLTELPVLYRFLDAATSSLVTGEEIGSLPTLAGLAYSLRGLDADDIYFTTMPFDWAGPRVVPSEEAELVWQALRNDEPVAEALQPPAEEPAPGEETEEPADPAEPSPAPTDDIPTRDATADEEGQTCTRADV